MAFAPLRKRGKWAVTQPTCAHLPHRDAKAVDVDLLGARPPQQQLRRHLRHGNVFVGCRDQRGSPGAGWGKIYGTGLHRPLLAQVPTWGSTGGRGRSCAPACASRLHRQGKRSSTFCLLFLPFLPAFPAPQARITSVSVLLLYSTLQREGKAQTSLPGHKISHSPRFPSCPPSASGGSAAWPW